MRMGSRRRISVRNGVAAAAPAVVLAFMHTTVGAERAHPDDAEAPAAGAYRIDSSLLNATDHPRRQVRSAPQPGPLPTFRGGGVDLLDAADQYTFFEGFESYTLGPLSGQLANAAPGVVGLLARNAMEIVTTASQGLPPGRDPFGTGDLQHLKDARGAAGSVSGVSETRWRFVLDELYTPTAEEDLIICVDMFMPDLNTLYSFEPLSIVDDRLVTRVLLAGRWSHGLTSDTEGELTRPAVLGLFEPPIGQFFAPPLSTDTNGALAPYRTRLNEWFTIAVRMTEDGFSVWIRDQQTDGSLGVLIEDPIAAPFLESGWCRIYPGRPAQPLAPGVWTSYGVAVNEFGEEAPLAEQFLAANAMDAIQSVWFPQEAIPDDPLWFPTNRYIDNICILGPSFTPPTPCPWDLTGSGAIGPGDLGILLGCWGQAADGACAEADFTGSGAVGASDLAQLLSNWGTCPP